MALQANRDMQSRKVNVDKDRLLETIYRNLNKHKEEYQESVKAYKTKAKEELAKAVEKAKAKLEKNKLEIEAEIEKFPNQEKSIQTLVEQEIFKLPVPKDYSEAYEKAMEVFKWEVSNTIELSMAEFTCYILDEWEWTDLFKSVSSFYNGPVGSSQ